MNKFVTSAILTALSLTAHLHARSNTDKTSPQPPLFDQGLGLPANKYPAAYNAPACIDVKQGWDFDVFGSFIYWHVAQDGMDIAYVSPVVSPSPDTQILGVVEYQRFTYQPGFKAGLGFDFNYDGWVCWAEYTWLHQSVSGSRIAPPTPAGAPGLWNRTQWFIQTGIADTFVQSTWKTKFDQIDAVVSRPYYEGTQLTLSPYAGMRALWLRQNLQITMVNNISNINHSTSKNNSYCWSLGPVAGALGHWMLGAGFRFEGNSAVSLLYTRYTKIVHTEQAFLAFPAPVTSNGRSIVRNLNTLRPTLQIGVGLGWGSYFASNKYYFDLSARYDFLYYWHQNMMREVLGNMRGYADAAGDFEMHGLTVNARFDF